MAAPNRRDVLRCIGSAGIALTLPSSILAEDSALTKKLKFGIIADVHGGFVRDAESRLDSFLHAMKTEKCDALVQLGDFAFPNAKHQQFADKFNQANDVAIHVIGNHEFDYELTRQDCCKAWGIASSYYVRDVGGLRLIVLDGNETGSPTYKEGYPSFIGAVQVDWLKQQLEKADRPVLILSHQPLAGAWPIDNAVEIQTLLAQHKEKVLLCMNGHSHIDSLVEVSGVRYLHINSASYFWVGGKHRTAFYKEPLFSMMSIDPKQGTISITGKSSSWKGMNPVEMGYFETKKDPPPQSSVVPKISDYKIAKA